MGFYNGFVTEVGADFYFKLSIIVDFGRPVTTDLIHFIEALPPRTGQSG